MGEKITDLYLLRRENSRRKELDAWMASKLAEVEKEAKEPPPPKIGTPGFLGWAAEKSGFRMGSPEFIDWLKKEGYSDPGTAEHVDINIFKPAVDDLFGVILNPGEWPAMFAGGAWGAYRTGLPILKTGIDWTLLGLPSLGKGIVGFVRGLKAGLAAPRLERPLKEGVETITDVVSRIPGMQAAGEIAPTGMAAAVKEMEVGATALASKIESAGATLSDFTFAGKLFRSGKIDANPEGTYYALSREGAKMYKELLGSGPVKAYELPPVKNTIVLDIDEHLSMIEKWAGKTLDDVGDISILLEDALPGIKRAGYDSAVVVGELGPETWGPPIEFIDLRPMAERLTIKPVGKRVLGVQTAEQIAEHRAATLGGRIAMEQGLSPAVRTNKGTIVTGKKGELHFQLLDRVPKGEEVARSGWTDKAGKFMTDMELGGAAVQPAIKDLKTGKVYTHPEALDHPDLAKKVGILDDMIKEPEELWATGRSRWQQGSMEGGEFVVGDPRTTRAEGVARSIQNKIDDTVAKVNNLAANWEKIVEKQRRGVISHEEAREMGKALGWGLDDIKKLFPGTPMNAEQASHLVDTIKPLADDSVRAAHRYIKTRSPEDMHEALYKFSALMEVDPKRLGVLAEAGRTLSQLNEPISGVNQYLDQFAKAFSELGPEGITPEILVQMLSKFQTPEQLAIMARHLAKPGSVKAYAEALMEGWVMGLLTGPRTHLVNFTSNCLTAILGPTERALAARLAFGEGKHVVKGEATEMVYGMIEGFMDGLSLAAKTWRTGVSHFGAEKAEYIGKKAISAEALNASGTFGRAVDVLGEAVRAPGRALIAADDIWKSVNFRANMRALALREGRAQGLERDTVEMANFIEDFIKAPPVKAVQASRGFANYMTFTKELDGLAYTAQRVLEHHPFLRVIIPFWRTPVNIFKFSLERTPLLNALSGQIRRDIAAGGVRRDMALGKIALSSMIAATVYTLARAGYITGSGPENKNLKEICKQAGRQRDSIRVGKGFYSYSRVDPLSIMIGSVANLAEVSDYLDQPQIEQYVMALVLGFSEHSVSKTYLTGLSNVIDALKEPDKQAIDYMESWTRSLVPTAMRHVAYQIDPIMRETIGVFDNIIAGTPWGSKSLPAKRNLKGEPVVSEGSLGPDMFSFIFKSTMKDDPVWKELLDNKVSVSPVARHMGGPRPPRGVMGQETIMHGVELTAPEYDWVCRMAGNEMKVDGMGMWDKLGWLIQQPEYKNATPGPYGSKALMIKAIVNAYRDLAFAKLRQASPKLDEALRQKEIARGEELKP